MKTHRILAIGHSQRFLGRTWLGPLQPGRYRAGFRVKWLDPSASTEPHAWMVHAYVDIHNHETARDFLTPNCWDTAQSERFVQLMGAAPPPDRFRKLPPLGEWGYLPIEFELREAGHVNACLILDTDRDGGQKFYLDHIKTELLEPYGDAKQAEWHPMEKPSGLRAPQGSNPQRALVVRGLFWQPYVQGGLEGVESAYQLPETHAALYPYDAVILCDFNATTSAYASRKVLRDWVEDGGRLVLLGGPETLGQGGMVHSYFEEMLPVRQRGPSEVVRGIPPPLLRVEKGTPAADRPAIFWWHDVTPQPDATVLAWADDRPVVLSHRFRKGVVCVFAGTTLGEGDEKHRPFWETETWKELLQRLVHGTL